MMLVSRSAAIGARAPLVCAHSTIEYAASEIAPPVIPTDPAFSVAFGEEGRHTIRAEGYVEDVDGIRWDVGGIFEIDVAGRLSLDEELALGFDGHRVHHPYPHAHPGSAPVDAARPSRPRRLRPCGT